MKVLLFGAVLWDIIEGQEHLGGAPFNVAAHLAQCGVESYMVTRVGDDERGRRVLAEMARLNVNTKFVTVDAKHPTGTVTVELDGNGQPTYTIHENVAWDFITVTPELLATIQPSEFAAVYFGSLDQRNDVSRTTLTAILDRLPNVPTFFDVNLRQHYYSADLLRESLRRTTLLKLNEHEVAVISQLLYQREDGLKAFAERAASDFALQAVIITRGDQGCLVWHAGKLTECPSQPVKVADSVGAGDAFSAGFLYEYCAGKPPAEAVVLANELGGFVASQRGAIPTFPPELIEQLKR